MGRKADPTPPLTDEQRGRVDGAAVAAALKVAGAFARRRPWLAAEYESDAMLAVVTAARHYRPELRRSFRTFAAVAAGFACRRRDRAERPRGFRSFGRPAPAVGGLAADPAAPAEPDAVEPPAALLALLPPAQRAAVAAWFRPRAGALSAAVRESRKVAHLKLRKLGRARVAELLGV